MCFRMPFPRGKVSERSSPPLRDSQGKSGSGGLPIVSATVSRASMDSCIHATVLAVACVMAGSGDYETLGILRRLWKREEANYGQHMAVGMAIGILFLGAGHFSLAKDPSAVAALLIACYPRFPSHPGDNAYHLQAWAVCRRRAGGGVGGPAGDSDGGGGMGSRLILERENWEQANFGKGELGLGTGELWKKRIGIGNRRSLEREN